jgi:hypothetical protein
MFREYIGLVVRRMKGFEFILKLKVAKMRLLISLN